MARSDEEAKTGSETAAERGGLTPTEGTNGGSDPQSGGKATSARSAGAAAKDGGAQATDAVAMLKEDHRKVEALFAEFESADDQRKEQIIGEACQELIIHSLLEERVFYPAARQPSTDDQLDEAQVEHDAAKVLIVELQGGAGRDEFREAKFKVLAEEIRSHIREEEAPDGVLAKAQKGGVNTRELAERLAALKQQLQARAQSGRLPEPEPTTFRSFGEPMRQERKMPRERDEYGRFTSDDDDRGYRSRGRDYDDDRDYRSRGRYYRDYDDNRSRGAQRGGEIRSERARSGSNDRRGYAEDVGQGGWFGDREGHSAASRRGWDNPDHGPSGWFGDREEHSRASQRGWDDPDHRPSGWFGDREGHSEASRRGWDNPDHGRSGWYGDPEGHSEASRRGWEERGGGRGSGRYEERSYARGRYDRDDDDDGRSSRGRGGHGGWSGDPEGHAEAARRGWQNRR